MRGKVCWWVVYFINLDLFSKSITDLNFFCALLSFLKFQLGQPRNWYSVGDVLQDVMKFVRERQLDEAVGNIAGKQLLEWLLTHL